MDNPMSENNIEVNNSISDLSFLWTAVFKDYTYISQVENGIEHKFQEVKDRFNELKYFTLQHKEKEISFTVDLVNGLIIYNNFKNTEVVEKKDNIRLIYFRRNRITMTESGDQQSHTITYHLGLQWLNSKKENRQTVLKIDENGNWVLGD